MTGSSKYLFVEQEEVVEIIHVAMARKFDKRNGETNSATCEQIKVSDMIHK